MVKSNEALVDVHLRGDEELVELKTHVPPQHDMPPSVLRALVKLSGVTNSLKIGENGPCNASDMGESASEGQGKYDVFFGRDGHIVAQFLAYIRPELARVTVMRTLETMGTRDNYLDPVHPYDEQEVGKPAHEVRDSTDSIARELTEQKDWGWPYYGAVDVASKNIITIGKIIDNDPQFLNESYTDKDGNSHSVRHGLELNADWLCGRMDMNPEGLVESLWKNRKHHPNQTWVDSTEGFYHGDGSWPEHHPENNHGVAAVEQQAETYDALLVAAKVAEQTGYPARASQLRHRANKLQRVVLDKFWVEDPTKFGGYFAQGTDRDADGNLRPLKVRSSDMGNILNSGLLMPTGDKVLDEELARKRDAVIRNLFSDDMLCPSGIRTKSKDSARYDPDRYHGGNSWPWVSAYIANGLEKHGYDELANELRSRVLETANTTNMLGEYVSGHDDPRMRIITQKVVIRSSTNPFEKEYVIAQLAQEVQAWTAAAILQIKRLNDPFAKRKRLPRKATDSDKRSLEEEVLQRVAVR